MTRQLDRLDRARRALARALAAKADPWRVTELRQAYDDALSAALDAQGRGGSVGGLGEYPDPASPAEELPLAWVDESGRNQDGRMPR